MLKSLLALAITTLVLAACVAPEEPEQPRALTATKPAAAHTSLEDAPIPNRRVGRSSSDEIIRFAP